MELISTESVELHGAESNCTNYNASCLNSQLPTLLGGALLLSVIKQRPFRHSWHIWLGFRWAGISLILFHL